MADHNNIDSYGLLHYDLRQFVPNSISDIKKKIASSTFCNGVDYKQKYNFVLLRILLMSVLIIFSRSSFIQRGKNNFSPNFPGFPGVCVARGQNFVKIWEFKNNWKNSLEVFSFTWIYFKHEKKKKKQKKSRNSIDNWSQIYEMRCAIWYHLCNLKNIKNTHGSMLLLVKLQALGPRREFFTFFQLYKWYQIA